MNQIEKVYFINLDDRRDRLDHINNELERLGINKNKIVRVPGVKHIDPIKGLALAQLNVLNLFKESKLENVIILEDDFKLTISINEFNEILEHIWKNKHAWDMINLAPSDIIVNDIRDKYFYRCKRSWCTGALIIKREFIDEVKYVYEKTLKTGKPIDHTLNELMEDNNILVPRNRIAKQIDGYSDIWLKNFNWTEELKGCMGAVNLEK